MSFFKSQRSKVKISLKWRIFSFFLITLFGMCSIFTISFYHFISRSTFEKMDREYTALANDLNDTSGDLLWKLTLTSQQILENEEVQKTIASYQEETNPYQKQVFYSQLLDLVSSLTISEADIALFYFFDSSNGQIIYSTLPVDQISNAETLCLYQNGIFKYRGPTSSQSSFLDNPVLILDRKSTLPNGNEIYFSIETGYYSLDNVFRKLSEKSAYVIFTNADDIVLYNSMPEAMQKKQNIRKILSGENPSFHTFSETASQGWSTHVVVPLSAYTSLYQESLQSFLLVMALIAAAALVFAFFFWQSIYHPLKLFDEQLGLVLSDQPVTGSNSTNIPEFYSLFRKIELLQQQVQQALDAAVQKEKENTKIQLEKLRAQINPHFLMNTLNTIHWMALMNQQTEIDGITQALSHLLIYNLDKDSSNTTLQRELSAVNEYVRLQKVRYQFTYCETILPADSFLGFPCPKFILQPFVENSLSHGYVENMEIAITVENREEDLTITISDTGTGMTEEKLQNIRQAISSVSAQTRNASDTSPVPIVGQSGKGIGLSYVIGILFSYYQGTASLTVESTPDFSTRFCLILPKLKGCGYQNAENTDCR